MSANSNDKNRRKFGKLSRRQLMAGVEQLEARLTMAASVTPDPDGNFFNDLVMVKFQPTVTPAIAQSVANSIGASIGRSYTTGSLNNLYELKLPAASQNTAGVNAALAQLRTSNTVAYAEPNYVYTVDTTIPNDTQFTELYGLNNTGLNGGTIDADIDAAEAWDQTTGSHNTIIAVIDTGVDYTHPDLAANMWTNPGEIAGDGIDNDGNGYIDDTRGWDAINDDNDPMDDDSHGTHVSGTIGAVGNNNLGVTGVNWAVSIIPVKFLGPFGGSTADAVEAVSYVTTLKNQGYNIRASNNSWGGGGASLALRDAIIEHKNADLLFIAAAGNGGYDNDLFTSYPSGYDIDNIIAVAATDNNDDLAFFSQYGATTVDLAAPGVNILSTVPTFYDPDGYDYFNGTSMATPHVAGAVGILSTLEPGMSYRQTKDIILGGVDLVPSLSGVVLTNGRLNLNNSIALIERSRAQGYVWTDRNGDGIRQGIDTALANITVWNDANSNSRIDTGERTTQSDATGFYDLGPLPINAVIRSGPPVDYFPTTPAGGSYNFRFTVNGEIRTGLDFGLSGNPGRVSGRKYLDFNSNGVFEPGLGERPQPGVVIYADLDGDGRVGIGEPSAVTAADGSYFLRDVFIGTHQIKEVFVPGYGPVTPGPAGVTVVVTPFANITGVDFYNAPAYDWGDLPDSYKTSRATNGPVHGYLYGFKLGSIQDADANGHPTPNAQGDDFTALDDDDGVTFLNIASPGKPLTFQVEVNVPTGVRNGYLHGWIDWNQDGNFDANEKVVKGAQLPTGTHSFTRNVPSTTRPGVLYSRFRYASTPTLGPAGATQAGEVEDYRTPIYSNRPAPANDRFTFDQFSTGNRMDVLANDVRSVNGNLTIIAADFTEPGLTKITDKGGKVRLNRNGTPNNPTDDFLVYDAPALRPPGSVQPLTDHFTYRVNDTKFNSGLVHVYVSLEKVSTLPVAGDDYVNLLDSQNTLRIDVLDNDQVGTKLGVPFDAIKLLSVQSIQPKFGTVAINDNGTPNNLNDDYILYTPNPTLNRQDRETFSFSYNITNPGITNPALARSGTVTVHIGPNAPDANDKVKMSFRVYNVAANGSLGSRVDNNGGNTTYNLVQGNDYWVGVFGDDLRNLFQLPDTGKTGNGVYTPYVDVIFKNDFVKPVLDLSNLTGMKSRFAAPYNSPNSNPSGQLLTSSFISDMGAVNLNSNFFDGNVGIQDNAVFYIKFNAHTVTPGGNALPLWQSDPADDLTHKIFINRDGTPSTDPNDYDLQELANSEVAFLSSNRFRVVAAPAPTPADQPVTTSAVMLTATAPANVNNFSATSTAPGISSSAQEDEENNSQDNTVDAVLNALYGDSL